MDNWWQEREEIPQALGFISPGEEPKAANTFKVEGGPKSVWRIATELIATFEQNVKNQNDPRFTLCKVYLQDHLWRFVPLCPSPQQALAALDDDEEEGAPEEVCSLGVCVPHGLGEIWYIVRLVPTQSKISWRFDVAQRLNPYFVLTAVATPTAAGGYVFHHYYELNPYSAVLNTTLIGASGAWLLAQLKIFEAIQKALEVGKKRRLERAQQYTADIMDAWFDALRAVERRQQHFGSAQTAATALATTTQVHKREDAAPRQQNGLADAARGSTSPAESLRFQPPTQQLPPTQQQQQLPPTAAGGPTPPEPQPPQQPAFRRKVRR